MVRILVVLAFALLAACAPTDDLSGPPPALGAFRLGHIVVVSDRVEYGPFSRKIDEAQIQSVMTDAVARRLGPTRYDGDGLYHLGILVGGLVLAVPGVPVVYTPSSTMIIEVNVYDNATQARLNDEPKRIVIREGLRNAAPIVGSGIARDGAAQLENMAENAATAIQNWLLENPDWFAPKPDQRRVAFPGPGASALAN